MDYRAQHVRPVRGGGAGPADSWERMVGRRAHITRRLRAEHHPRAPIPMAGGRSFGLSPKAFTAAWSRRPPRRAAARSLGCACTPFGNICAGLSDELISPSDPPARFGGASLAGHRMRALGYCNAPRSVAVARAPRRLRRAGVHRLTAARQEVRGTAPGFPTDAQDRLSIFLATPPLYSLLPSPPS